MRWPAASQCDRNRHRARDGTIASTACATLKGRDDAKRKLVRELIDRCRDLDILFIAKGVETASERDVLLSLDCDLFQGNLFARPGAPFPQPSFV